MWLCFTKNHVMAGWCSWFITCPLHGQGPGFEPQTGHFFLLPVLLIPQLIYYQLPFHRYI